MKYRQSEFSLPPDETKCMNQKQTINGSIYQCGNQPTSTALSYDGGEYRVCDYCKLITTSKKESK